MPEYKRVGQVTGNQFGYLYIDGVPYNPAKVKRFLEKGSGIKLQDIVIFDADGDGVLSYIKNAIYADAKEQAMVKHHVRTGELQRARASQFLDVSDDIKKDLAMEGVVITKEGVFLTPPEDDLKTVDEVSLEMSGGNAVNIDPAVIDSLMPDQKRQVSIMLQSSLKLAGDINMIAAGSDGPGPVIIERIKRDALDIMFWVDQNSTQILSGAKEYIERTRPKKCQYLNGVGECTICGDCTKKTEEDRMKVGCKVPIIAPKRETKSPEPSKGGDEVTTSF